MVFVTFNLILFMISFFGILFNFKNILILLMGIEVLLLSLNLNFIYFSLYLDDIIGLLMAIFILTIAASESAIGLAIIILYYRLRGYISTTQPSTLRD